MEFRGAMFLPPVGDSSMLSASRQSGHPSCRVSTPCRGFIHAEVGKYPIVFVAKVSTPCRGFIHAELQPCGLNLLYLVSTPCRGFIHAEAEERKNAFFRKVSTPCRGFIHAEKHLLRILTYFIEFLPPVGDSSMLSATCGCWQ